MKTPFEKENFWAFFNSNGQGSHKIFAGIKASFEVAFSQKTDWNQVQEFLDRWSNHYVFVALSYELKNDIEQLEETDNCQFNFPKLLFVVPNSVGNVHPETYLVEKEWGESIAEDILLTKKPSDVLENVLKEKIEVKPIFSREQYIKKASELLRNIKLGNLYEVNFCQEFFCEKVSVNPWSLYGDLNRITEAPYSNFLKYKDQYLLCASPELYLKKEGEKISSSPIKGTAKRQSHPTKDLEVANQLRASEKERAENIMIVDLVRNDFSRISKKGTVRVSELCAIKSFKTVHHMVSTIEAELKEGINFTDILKATFPMGSMTGAPKIAAMDLAQKAEETPRGIYSGSVGFISPDGNFNLNVVIRSIQYDIQKKILNFKTGSALTAKCDPELEYEECLVKAKALIESLNGVLVS